MDKVFNFSSKYIFDPIRAGLYHLPLLFYAYMALILLFDVKALPLKYEFTYTVVFPFIWIMAYVYLVTKKSTIITLGSSLLFILISILILSLTKPLSLTRDTALVLYEYETITWTVVFMIHCMITLGRMEFFRFFIVGLLYGFSLESSGVSMGFFKESDYHIYIPLLSAPLATMIGWSTVFYSSVFITKGIIKHFPKMSNLVKALITSLVALFMDLQLDPIACKIGLWDWNDKLEPFFLGVPLINFVSWFFAVLAFGYMYFYTLNRNDWNMKRRIFIPLLSIPICQTVSGFFVFLTMILVEGISGPTMGILLDNLYAILSLIV